MVMASMMQLALDKNSHKGTWSHCRPSWLLRRLETEVRELRRAVRKREPASRVWQEAADVANFAAMVADVVGDRQGKRRGQ